MSQSQSHSMSEQTIVYQQQQVLWAKIRGYPWWPAFVDKVHGGNSQEIEYTVFFFGDNTHSRLGASKLRRFLDYYTEFFPKAKTNRKLYLSIMKAEEKLKQNGGNVDIFETLRNSLKKNKKPKPHNKTESRIDSEDHPNISQQPQLMRNKTFPVQSKQGVSEQQSEEKPRRRGRKSRREVERQPSQKQEIQSQREESIQQEKEEKQEVQQPQPVLNYRTRSGRNKVETVMVDEKEQKVEELKQEEQQSESEKEETKKTYPLRFPAKTKPLSRGGPKKRGRPKKVMENNEESPGESEAEHSEASETKKPPVLMRAQSAVDNRKTRAQRALPVKVPISQRASEKEKPLQQQPAQKPQTNEQTKELILSRVRFCLDKRNELIQYLDELNVTTDIVQEILDLDVTTVLQQGGEHTAQSIRVLHKLRSALLHKYFPDDIKIKKKYEKITKKPNSNRSTTAENEESLQDLQLRRKTLIKLEKILKNLQASQQSNHTEENPTKTLQDHKQRAIQIESYFRKYDESINTNYKTIAYKVLRALKVGFMFMKDKSASVEDVLGKLEAGEFDEEEK